MTLGGLLVQKDPYPHFLSFVKSSILACHNHLLEIKRGNNNDQRLNWQVILVHTKKGTTEPHLHACSAEPGYNDEKRVFSQNTAYCQL